MSATPKPKKWRVVKCGPCWALERRGRVGCRLNERRVPNLRQMPKQYAMIMLGPDERLLRVVGLVVEDVT
jgi:hypothetical protein